MMTDIILHHYETSPYSEKVRLGLGLKGLSWASVEIPVIMPKPNLTALTGGYRKTPVLQIGADIYCDSQLIMCELERRHPSPSFYPTGRGAADALAWWAEKTMFAGRQPCLCQAVRCPTRRISRRPGQVLRPKY
jgi:glutathione S-transferase